MIQNEQDTLRPDQQRQLRQRLEIGLPHCSRPYQSIAQGIGASEAAVIQCVLRWHQEGLFRRFGLVIHHRRVGISANLMLALDIPDHAVHRIGDALANEPRVTLCYQRRRQLPDWPYNLFCMIHGRDRIDVVMIVEDMLSRLELDAVPRQMLFSVRAFKQRGARYIPAPTENTIVPDKVPPRLPEGARHG